MNRTQLWATIKSRGGFTLIELLVVVAIISILASIAVPNFLDAQTRAKVARTKADMRTLATALESYHVDRSAYPYRHNAQYTGATSSPMPPLPEVIVQTPSGPYQTRLQEMSVITTPVAYLSSLPMDVFEKTLPWPNNVIDYWDPTQVMVFINANYPYASPKKVGTSDLGWLLASVGPDGFIGQTSSADHIGWPWRSKPIKATMNLCYDPTNGTISTGNIYMSGVLGLDQTPTFITSHLDKMQNFY